MNKAEIYAWFWGYIETQYFDLKNPSYLDSKLILKAIYPHGKDGAAPTLFYFASPQNKTLSMVLQRFLNQVLQV